MAQIETAPRARSRRAGSRSGSGRPKLVLVAPLPPEAETATGLAPQAEAATGVAEPSRRTVLRGTARARQLPPTPPVRERVRPRSQSASPVRERVQPQSPPAPVPSRTEPIQSQPAPVRSRTEQWEPGRAAPVWSKAGAPPLRRPAGSTLRLTTRGRVAVVAVLVAPLLMLSLLFRSQVDASSDPTAPHPVIVVQPGDTLWTIADRVAPDRDPRAMIHQIREINGLSSASIQAGQRLAVPPG